jgi:hypothetical protein
MESNIEEKKKIAIVDEVVIWKCLCGKVKCLCGAVHHNHHSGEGVSYCQDCGRPECCER